MRGHIVVTDTGGNVSRLSFQGTPFQMLDRLMAEYRDRDANTVTVGYVPENPAEPDLTLTVTSLDSDPTLTTWLPGTPRPLRIT